MKSHKFLFKVYIALLLAVLGLIVLHAPLTVWLSSEFSEYSLAIKAWKEILLLVALPIGVWLALKSGVAKAMWRDKLFLAIAAFALLHLLLLGIFKPSLGPAIAGLMIDLRYLLFFVLLYIALKIEPRYRRLCLQLLFCGAMVVLGFALLQMFILPADILKHIGYSKATISPYLTVDKNPEFIRINSTLRGPNPVGAYALMWLSLLTAYLAKTKEWRRNFKFGFLAFLGIISGLLVLWASYSRSALFATAISIAVVLIVVMWHRPVARKWFAGAAILLMVVGSLAFILRSSSFVQQVVLHNNPQGGSRIDSTQAHLHSLENGTERLISQPFGAGIGSTGSASLLGDEPAIIENQYLFVAHETGWLGLALFLFIFIVILQRLWRSRRDWLALGVFAGGVGLGLIGLLLPVWADDTVSIIWWGLAAIALASLKGSYGRKSAKQKAA